MFDISKIDLPDVIKTTQSNAPITDICLEVLRKRLPGFPFFTKIPFKQTPAEISPFYTFAIVRPDDGLGFWNGIENILDNGGITIQVFTHDPDGELKGILVSNAIKLSLFAEKRDRTFFPGLGGICGVTMTQEPIRRADWATATGPVQYADLPTGYWRHESKFDVFVRPDMNRNSGPSKPK